MLLRTLPAGFIAPCLPTKTTKSPSGGQWLHEIKARWFSRFLSERLGQQVVVENRPGAAGNLGSETR
jgi:Tripartite tricarboxylate transporter family receptor